MSYIIYTDLNLSKRYLFLRRGERPRRDRCPAEHAVDVVIVAGVEDILGAVRSRAIPFSIRCAASYVCSAQYATPSGRQRVPDEAEHLVEQLWKHPHD